MKIKTRKERTRQENYTSKAKFLSLIFECYSQLNLSQHNKEVISDLRTQRSGPE